MKVRTYLIPVCGIFLTRYPISLESPGPIGKTDGIVGEEEEGTDVVEETGYADDENEWDDLGYTTEPEAAEENSTLGGPLSALAADSNLSLDQEAPNDPQKGIGIPDVPVQSTPPQRKRSFSEVEAEPEGDLTHCKLDISVKVFLLTVCQLPALKSPDTCSLWLTRLDLRI